MKSAFIFALFTFICIQATYSQKEANSNDSTKVIWNNSTAKTLAPSRIEYGIFSPLSIGLKHNMELSVLPLTFFVMPNAQLKKNWTKDNESQWQLATEHGFTMPTLLMSLMATEGTIALYPPNEKAPPVFTIKNSIIGSYFYLEDHAVTFKAGFEFNLLGGQYGNFPEVELLYIYPRTASYSNPFTLDVSVGLAGNFTQKMGYDGALTLFYIPNSTNTMVFEFNPKLYYTFSNKLRMAAGVNLTAGNVPHEKQAFRALPFADLQWTMFQNRSEKRHSKQE
tara:strand:- start:138994 stop:139833 length:840 start_codon:yes stop_codon:yes gene_type:complete